MNALMVLGDKEGAWRAGEEMRTVAGGRPGRAPDIQYQNWDYLTWNLQAWLDETVADAETAGGAGNAVATAGAVIAEIQARYNTIQKPPTWRSRRLGKTHTIRPSPRWLTSCAAGWRPRRQCG